MELRQEAQKPLQRFITKYFKRLAADMGMLVSQHVEPKLKELKLLEDPQDIDSYFENELAIASVKEDGQDTGDVHLLFDVRSAIAFSGLMMMIAPGPLSEKVRLRAFDESLQEAFQEIGNIAVGTLNGMVEAETKGGHLVMQTAGIVEDMTRPEQVCAETYVAVIAEIRAGDFNPETFRILISGGVAELLAGMPLVLPPPVEDPDAADAGDAALLAAGDFELAALIASPSISADEKDTVEHAIAMMEQQGTSQIGVLREGILLRVITRSDLRQLMGPFYKTNAMSARDRAVLQLPLGRISKNQQLLSISTSGSKREAVELMIANDLRALPVVDDKGVFLGFIHTLELLKLLRTYLN